MTTPRLPTLTFAVTRERDPYGECDFIEVEEEDIEAAVLAKLARQKKEEEAEFDEEVARDCRLIRIEF